MADKEEMARDNNPGRTGGRARLVDVAARSGVTKSIVSRIINNDETLRTRPETRERVLSAAAELGYRPHASARALSLARAGALALLIPDLANSVYAAITRGALERASAHDFALLIAEDPGTDDEDRYLDLAVTGRVDGLLVASARPGHPLVERLMADPLPVPHVFVNREVAGSGRNIGVDMAGASGAVVDFLIARGHSQIGITAGPPDLAPSHARLVGFQDRMRHHNLNESAVMSGQFTEQGGYDATRRLLADRPEVTAIYVSTFGQGVGAIQAARDSRYSVPADLSIVAYDDLPMADFLNPRLTTVAMPLHELGGIAVDALTDQLGGAAPTDRRIEGGWEVIDRESVAAPRS